MRLEIHEQFLSLVPETPQDVSHLRVLGFPGELELVSEAVKVAPSPDYQAGFRIVLRRLVVKPEPEKPEGSAPG